MIKLPVDISLLSFEELEQVMASLHKELEARLPIRCMRLPKATIRPELGLVDNIRLYRETNAITLREANYMVRNAYRELPPETLK